MLIQRRAYCETVISWWRGCARSSQAVGAAEQRGEVRGVDQDDVAGARAPVGGIQISALNSVLPAAVKGCGRFGSTRWRPRTRRSVAFGRGQFVVRQVRVEVEGGDVVEQPRAVEIAEGGQRRDLVGAVDDGRAQPPGVVHRHVERLHQGAGVLAEALLAGHEPVAVVLVFHLALRRGRR